MSFLLDIVANIVAGAAAVLAVYVWAWLPKRAQRRWMGMTSKKPALQIYASNLTIKAAGAEPVEGEAVTVGFTGAAMNEKEYLSALRLRDSLRPSRIIEAVSDLFRRRVEETDVHVCPRKWDERRVPHSNLVFLGSPIYNSGTKHYLEGQTRVRFLSETPEGGPKQRVLRVDDQNYMRSLGADGGYSNDFGVIYRMEQNSRSIFICAGLGSEATCEAASYLATRWKEIKAEYGSGGFIILIRKTLNVAKPRVMYVKEVLDDNEYSGEPPEHG